MMENEDACSSTLVGDSGEDAKRSLCDRCKTLELNVEKFIVSTPTVAADVVRQPQRYEPREAGDNFSLKSGTRRKNFATLQQLRENGSSCAFCHLLRRAIERYSGGTTEKVDDDTSCSLCWEVHGRVAESESNFVNSTRRIRLSWYEKTGHTQDVFLLFVAPKDVSRPNSDATSRYSHGTHFLGRELGDQKEKQALIKSWLDLCINGHDEECWYTHGTDEEFRELVNETYFGVIDVADMQLKSLPLDSNGNPEPFVALSYVWGRKRLDEPPYVTNRVNVMTHILHGGLETAWDKLPRTLQDAILLVSRLGYRYLWIDSLCIVQDSSSSWQLNAQAMHLVYGNALFTICAADGRDSSVGLCAAEAILRVQGPGVAANRGRAQRSDDADVDSQPMSEDIGNNVRLMVTRPLEATVDDSEWNKRAWTFQERVLSRRSLIFAEGRVQFQCRTTCFSQDIYADGSTNVFSLDRANSPLRTLRELQQRPLWIYLTYVQMYTGRHLTKPGDILAAFEGIAYLLGQYMDAPSLSGLPTSHFDLALLWIPLTKIRHRRPRVPSESERGSCTQDAVGNCTCHAETRSFEGEAFPTWSWSGWMDGRIEYNPAMLEGCLSNVHEWLTQHTWIQWHVRDEKGHLRPLWDIMSQKIGRRQVQTAVETEEDGRWMGYPGRETSGEDGTATVRESTGRLKFREYDERDRDLDRPREEERGDRKREWERERVIRDREREDRATRDWSQLSDRNRRSQPRGYPHYPPPADDPPPTDTIPRLSRYSGPAHPPSPRPPPVRYTSPPPRSVIATTLPGNKGGPDRRRSPRRSSSAHSDHQRVGNGAYVSNEATVAYEDPQYERVVNQEYTQRQPGYIVERETGEKSSSNNSSVYEDNYGRHILKDRVPAPEGELMFRAILPDNPFGVIRDIPRSSSSRSREKRPKYKGATTTTVGYMPILQFHTWRTELHVVIRDNSGNNTAESTVGPANTGLCQCDILDKAGDWCGAIVLDDAWIRERQGHIFQFIAISDAKSFTREECPVWTYYIPKEQEESEWDVYFVLLLQRNVERGLWERVALGKVFKAAFRKQSWDEIKLG